MDENWTLGDVVVGLEDSVGLDGMSFEFPFVRSA